MTPRSDFALTLPYARGVMVICSNIFIYLIIVFIAFIIILYFIFVYFYNFLSICKKKEVNRGRGKVRGTHGY